MLGATRNAAAGAHGPVDQRLVRGGRAQHHLRVVNRPPFVDAVWKRRRLRRGKGGELYLVSVAYGYLGGWRKISRVLSDLGNDARGRDASIGTRSRTSDSSSMRDHDLDARRTPARGRSCQPRGRSVASVPVGCWKWEKKPQHPFAREKVVRRGRAGNARLHRPHGPCTRPKDPVDKIRRRAREIRDRTRWTRANIDVACRARLPGFQGKNRGECDRRVGRRTGVNLRASSPVWPVGSSTFARVLACRLKGVSRRVDWRAAVNRVLEARKEVAFELGREET